MKIRADVQYLRAVAVVLVILYHLPADWNLEGGFIGVDIFFVISGYVITQSLISQGSNEIGVLKRYVNFMSRRIKRLLPPLATTVTAGVVLAVLFAPITQFHGILDTSWFAGTFTGNYYFLRHFDTYWNPEILRSPYLHLWSLGVEFQVYLIWPLLVIRRGMKAGAQQLVLVLATLTSFILFVYFLVIRNVDFLGSPARGIAFYSPVTRLWQVGIGGIMFLLRDKTAFTFLRRLHPRLLGVFLIMVSVIQSTRVSRLSLWVIAACMGAALVILDGTPLPQSRLFIPLGWIGDRSYSIYLWHWPLLAVALWIQPGNIWWAFFAVLLALPMGNMSYRWLERGRSTLGTRRIKRMSTATVVMCGTLAVSVPLSTSAWFNQTRPLAAVAMSFPDNGPSGQDMMEAVSNCASISGDKWIECNNFAETDNRIMVIGDSLAYRSLPAIQFWARSHGYNTTMMWTGRCTFARDSCHHEIGRQIYDYLPRHRIAAIFEAANFDRPADRVNASEKAAGLAPTCDQPTSLCPQHLQWLKSFSTDAEPGLSQLEEATPNIIVSLPFPQQSEFAESCLQLPIYKRIFGTTLTENCGRTSVAWQTARQGLIPQTIKKAVAGHRNVRLWDPQSAFCRNGWCPAVINDGERIMDDAIHWSWPAARFMVPQVSEMLDSFELPIIQH